MTDKLSAWWQRGKDSTVSFVLEKSLKKFLERYGEVLDFKVDSRQSSAQLQLQLKGEADSVTVFVDEYKLLDDSGGTYLRLERVRSSREWLSLLLADFVIGKRLPIPEKYAKLARMVL